MKKKILAISSIRSDYDLMYPLYRLLQEDPEIELKLLVSGAHMSYSYGHTVDMIERDGITILQRCETLLDSDTKQARAKSAGLLLQSAVDVISQYAPDMMLYAGDREDVLVGAMIAGYLGIPSVHFYGGDHSTDGYIDNPVRHAVTKLSTVHMVTLDQHRDRILGMGEASKRIHVVGNISLDNFVTHVPEPLERIKQRLGITRDFEAAALVIYHPISGEIEQCDRIFESILMNLKKAGVFGFVSYPNVDPGNKKIVEVCRRYTADDNFYFYQNLERETFLSIYKSCNFIIGNSSSGVLESASIPIPTINVGLRQLGRFAPENVLFCDADDTAIRSSVHQVTTKEFLSMVKNIRNPYGNGESARRAYEILRDNDFCDLLAKTEDPLNYDPQGKLNQKDRK